MILSKKKIEYLKSVNSNNLLSRMKKYKMIEDLSMYGVVIDENADITSDVVRDIYFSVMGHLIDKYVCGRGVEEDES